LCLPPPLFSSTDGSSSCSLTHSATLFRLSHANTFTFSGGVGFAAKKIGWSMVARSNRFLSWGRESASIINKQECDCFWLFKNTFDVSSVTVSRFAGYTQIAIDVFC